MITPLSNQSFLDIVGPLDDVIGCVAPLCAAIFRGHNLFAAHELLIKTKSIDIIPQPSESSTTTYTQLILSTTHNIHTMAPYTTQPTITDSYTGASATGTRKMTAQPPIAMSSMRKHPPPLLIVSPLTQRVLTLEYHNCSRRTHPSSPGSFKHSTSGRRSSPIERRWVQRCLPRKVLLDRSLSYSL